MPVPREGRPQDGRAFVVVRVRESRTHGEGRQVGGWRLGKHATCGFSCNDADHHPEGWAPTPEATERGERITRTEARSKGRSWDVASGRPDDPHDRTDRGGGG